MLAPGSGDQPPARVALRIAGGPGKVGPRLLGLGHCSWLLVAIKIISKILGHATSAIIVDIYIELAEELTDAAASAITALTETEAWAKEGDHG